METSGLKAEKYMEVEIKKCDSRKSCEEVGMTNSTAPPNTECHEDQMTLTLINKDAVVTNNLRDTGWVGCDESEFLVRRDRTQVNQCKSPGGSNAGHCSGSTDLCMEEGRAVKTSMCKKQESARKSKLYSKLINECDQEIKESVVVLTLPGDNKHVTDSQGDNKQVTDSQGDNKQVIDSQGDNKQVADSQGDNKPVTDSQGDNKPVTDSHSTNKLQLTSNEAHNDDSHQLQTDICFVNPSSEHCNRTFTESDEEGEDFTFQVLTHEKSLVCEFCNKEFKSMDLLKRHSAIHTNEGTYTCEYCNISFMLKSKFENHVALHTNHTSQETYMCLKCDRPFKRKEDLILHMKSKACKNPLVCVYCNKVFTFESKLKEHMISHTDERPHVCEYCGMSCKSKRTLKAHERIHTGEGLHTCTHCHKSFRYKTNLTHHLRTHTGERPYKCSYCSHTSNCGSNLRKHEKVHLRKKQGQRDVKCINSDAVVTDRMDNDSVVHDDNGKSDCSQPEGNTEQNSCNLPDGLDAGNYSGSTNLLMGAHGALKMPKSDRQEWKSKSEVSSELINECDQELKDCSLVLPLLVDSKQETDSQDREKNLELTSNVGHDEENHQLQRNTCFVNFTCEHCNKTFTDEKSFTCHISMHEHKKLFVCEFCGKVLKTLTSLKSHKVTHTNDGAYTCEFCDKSFLYESHLDQHVMVHTKHTNLETFSCPECGKSFNRKERLTLHMERSHAPENSFTCKYCDKSFSFASRLKEHMTSHTDERPYVCKLCGKAFKYKKQLTLHDNIHTSEKLYTCGICHKSFHRKEHLTDHMRIHTGERPFKCSYCIYAAKRKGDLNAHERAHRDEKVYKCDLCEYSTIVCQIITKQSIGEKSQKRVEINLKHCSFSQQLYFMNHRKTLSIQCTPHKVASV